MSNAWKPSAVNLSDRSALIDRLSHVPVGETISYEELTAVVGRDIRGPAYGALCSARKHLRLNQSVVFGTVPCKGLRRLDDLGKIAAAHSWTGRERRAAIRAIELLSSVDHFDDLSAHARGEHNALMALNSAVSTMTQKKSLDRLQERTIQAGRVLPLARTLEVFM